MELCFPKIYIERGSVSLAVVDSLGQVVPRGYILSITEGGIKKHYNFDAEGVIRISRNKQGKVENNCVVFLHNT